MKLLLLALLAAAAPAAAQSSAETSTARPIELFVGTGGVVSIPGNGGDVSVMVSVPRESGTIIEGFVGAYAGNDALDTKAVYGVQVRQPIRTGRARTIEPFWTWGFTGAVARYETSSCVNKHCTSQRDTHLLPPALFVLGAGFEYRLKPRVAVRFDYQAGVFLVVPVGVRAAAGVSIPIGRGSAFRAAE